MSIRRFTILGVALVLLTACTTGKQQQSTGAPPPTMQGKAVVLTNANLPPQGSNYRDSSNRWQVHGVISNVSYRYGQTDPTHLFVANTPGMSWTAASISVSTESEPITTSRQAWRGRDPYLSRSRLQTFLLRT